MARRQKAAGENVVAAGLPGWVVCACGSGPAVRFRPQLATRQMSATLKSH